MILWQSKKCKKMVLKMQKKSNMGEIKNLDWLPSLIQILSLYDINRIDRKFGVNMENRKLFEAKEFKSVKEIIYESAKKYNEKTAFVIKHQENKEVTYENISYKGLLEDINKLGTMLYEKGFKGKRIAVIGKNRYDCYT